LYNEVNVQPWRAPNHLAPALFSEHRRNVIAPVHLIPDLHL